jgi:hypothetical protein
MREERREERPHDREVDEEIEVVMQFEKVRANKRHNEGERSANSKPLEGVSPSICYYGQGSRARSSTNRGMGHAHRRHGDHSSRTSVVLIVAT